MADLCETCVHYPPSSFGGKPCSLCDPSLPALNFYQRREEPPQTNGDWLRTLPDEEMAEYFYKFHHDARLYNGKVTVRRFLNWLQEPHVDSPVDGGGGDD